MKITRSQLKKLIKEELEGMTEEDGLGDEFRTSDRDTRHMLRVDPELDGIIDPTLYRKALRLMAGAFKQARFDAGMSGSRTLPVYAENAFLEALKAANRGVESVEDDPELYRKIIGRGT